MKVTCIKHSPAAMAFVFCAGLADMHSIICFKRAGMVL